MQLVADEPAKPAAVSSRAVLIVGLVLIGAFVALSVYMMSVTKYDTWAAVLIAPVLLVVSLPFLSRQATKEGDRRIFVFLTIALIVKLAGAFLAYYVAFDVYGGLADANLYYEKGVEISEGFRAGDYDTGLDNIGGTNFPMFLNGIIFTLIRPTKLGGFLIYAWLAFWGLFFFYRAFLIAVPEGRSRTYAALLFFLPSSVVWTALMGKDPWMVLTLGIAAYGIARILSQRTWRGLAIAGLGLWAAAIVRPHVAAMIAVAAAGAYLLARPRPELRQLAVVVKTMGLIAVAVIAVLLVRQADRFLEERGVDADKGVTSALEDSSRGGASGGSLFAPQIIRSPKGVPGAVLTVLFRPFVTEVNTVQGMVAAAEGLFLLGLCVIRARWIGQALRSVRRRPYIAVALAFTAMFIFAFSSFANFGLLARQRVQLIPLFLVLLSVPPPKKAPA